MFPNRSNRDDSIRRQCSSSIGISSLILGTYFTSGFRPSLTHRPCSSPGLVVVATLVGGGSGFSAAPSSPAVRARQSRHMMTARGQGGRVLSGPTSRQDVIGAVFGAVAASSFAFVAAADAKVWYLQFCARTYIVYRGQ